MVGRSVSGYQWQLTTQITFLPPNCRRHPCQTQVRRYINYSYYKIQNTCKIHRMFFERRQWGNECMICFSSIDIQPRNVHISRVPVVLYTRKICPTWVDVNDLCLVNYYTCKKLHCNNQSFFHRFLKISVKYWLCPICADSSGRTSSFRVKYPNTSGHHNNHGDEDEVEDDDEDAGTLVIKEEYPEGGSVHGAQESSPPTTCK